MSTQTVRERDQLIEKLTEMLGDMANVVTLDAQEARPLPGKVSVLIDPPTISFEGWQYVNRTWRIAIIAATPTTQADAFDLLMEALERLHERHLNMKEAQPASFSLAGVGSLAAYEITLNPLELIEEGE
ncbi:hypothetical protein BREU_1257 [Bifidobacterium reuteri DSM 23975]|uniref:Phage protein n=1 Tax=Bifidobacterium reuteri DSM 23975 TaxID=1437610 RepID=A0A087CMI2_9BIFI|nr:hypothetical protein [Bifidobacterium reuteri]KFI84482.1 hypothetical protein BREU_1257 [Bifidobacterium reuteri DSM 23975]